MAQSAFWASWADAMPMISERLPEVVNRVELQLAMEEPSDPWVNFKRQLKALTVVVLQHGPVGQH